MIASKLQIEVIDLDGTLFRTNTFHRWLIFHMKFYISRGNVIKVSYTIVLIFLRLIRIISHKRLKYYVMILMSDVNTAIFEYFVLSLSKYQNTDVLNLVDENSFKVLATAAPCYYSDVIARNFKFDMCLSTMKPEGICKEWRENLGQVKRDNVLEHLKAKGLEFRIATVFTDHHDDIPLMLLTENVHLVAPSPKTLNEINALGINYTIIS